VIEFLVAADDRTGALEAAGACADAGLSPAMAVTTIEAAVDHEVVVVDLATRHVPPSAAARRGAMVDGVAARRVAHKIDSLLRGNWATELVARQRAGGRRVLLVPAAPALGRTCVGGVVHDDGRPVADGPAGRDARAPVRSSRPAEHLYRAGAESVTKCERVEQVAGWVRGGEGAFAVCDAATNGDVEALAALWASGDELLLAGPAAVIGAAAGPLSTGVAAPAPTLLPPALIVVGSLHAVARQQIGALAAAVGAVVIEVPASARELESAASALAVGRPVVLTTTVPVGGPVAPDRAIRTASRLAHTCHRVLAAVDVATLVVLGGDTAAAVLGPEPLAVGGTVAPGTPWARHGGGRLIVTRAGGFGSDRALVELLGAAVVP
jgi:4-hydroxythreonine-4-phosphate dehydrogenase